MNASALRRLVAGGFALAGVLASSAWSAGPAELGAPGLWLSGRDFAAGAKDGQAVTRWADRSGNGFDAVFEERVPQAGRVSEGHHRPPVVRVAAIDGQPAVSFTATERQSLLLSRPGHALGQKVKGFTAAFLVRPTLSYPAAPAADMPWTIRRYLFIIHSSDYSTRLSVQIIQDTGEVKLLSRPVPGADLERTSSLEQGGNLKLRDGVWQRLIVTVDYEAKEARIYVDGASTGRKLNPKGANVSEDVPSPITGIASTTLGDWLNCQLAELICYERALGTDEVRALDSYLAHSYHLTP